MHVDNIIISASKIPSDLSAMNIHLKLDKQTSDFWSIVSNGGGDIRLFKDDGVTELAREVVSCDTATQTGELHLLYPTTVSSSVDTIIQVHVDGVSSDYAATDPYGKNAVWDTNCMGIWHMGEASGSVIDSTASAHAGARFGATQADGKLSLNGAQLLNGSAHYFTVPHHGDFNLTNLTISAWMKHLTRPVNYAHAISKGYISSAYHWLINNNDRPIARLNTSFGNVDASPAGTYSTGVWTLYHMTYDGTTIRHYVNGVEEATAANPFGITASTRVLHFGRTYGTTSHRYAGTLDEIRILNTAKSADYITAEFNNQSDPDTFYSVVSVLSGGNTIQPTWFM